MTSWDDIIKGLRISDPLLAASLAAAKDAEYAKVQAKIEKALKAKDAIIAEKDEALDAMQRKNQRLECEHIARAFATRAFIARPCRRECPYTPRLEF